MTSAATIDVEGYPFATFEAYLRRIGKVPTSIGLPGLSGFRPGDNVAPETAQRWADLLSVDFEDIWPPDPARPRVISRDLEDDTPAQRPSEPSNLRGISRARADDAKRKADCTVAINRACAQWSEAFTHLMLIARHDESGIGVEGELQQEYRILRKALRDVEAWYGSLTYAEVLAELVLSGKPETPEINLTGGEQ